MSTQTTAKRPNAFLEIIFNIAIPSLILMKLSGDEYLGTVPALIVALLFPLGYGLSDFIRNKSMNFIALLGFLSTLLTGSIGLFELDVEWLAIKEAAIPAVIGLVVLISGFWGKPLIAKVMLNPLLFNLDLIYQTLENKNKIQAFKARIQWANHLLSSTFVFSAAMNYLLAKWIVVSPAGTTEFNEQLGEMTLLSYPVIAIPSMVMLIAIMFYVVRSSMKLTGLTLDQILNGEN
ncbi:MULTISPECIES: VC0807 family protein [unclassified Colwellia]|uniref:VC0807 family protein n=1 Tax=unclassified Colwellia TaxID=196834 RepID=UPI0015F6C69B|nr:MULTISPECIES: VC0807 family protein [unclassified Colwellia]MBA6233329.1 MFS transporter [Colwellia sp. MB02u-7]MBA6236419.1 MFS transporter [Colwellia sp. MB02u-11]MBA6256953.1 MFS transporter [Colwellia sp. MB3u-28]MBA6261041.1 MFS transporter [Colwellia sp. MB3u-41]MBA6298181.1 MFS transporter [Colwellia sp. MB3u-22]